MRRSLFLLHNSSLGFRYFSTKEIPASSLTGSSHEDLIIHQAETLLNQKKYVLELIKPEDYTKRVPSIFNSSIGGHIRHSLDHFSAVVQAASSKDSNSLANYDQRARNTEIEVDPKVAMALVNDLIKIIPSLPLKKEIDVSFIGDEKSFRSYQVKSSVVRELSFASHHAIHHLSMIKLILSSLSYELPPDSPLGIALSTAKELQNVIKKSA
jgi:hypothetical protein